MKTIQEMLDQEAAICNLGFPKSEERMKLHTLIRLKREGKPPACFGADDCSASMLSRCAWRMDCGAEEFHNWGG